MSISSFIERQKLGRNPIKYWRKKGVTIGNSCIIGVGAIVTKDVPNNSVVAGVPARVIRTIEEYKQKKN